MVSQMAARFEGNQPSMVNMGKNVKPQLPLAVSMWIKVDSFQPHQFIIRSDKWGSGSDYAGFHVSVNHGYLTAGYGNNNGAGAGARRTLALDSAYVSSNEWHHVVVNIKSKTDFKIYVDTTLAPGSLSGSVGAMNYNDNTNGFIGVGMAQNDPFTGTLDELKIYDRALRLSEIDSLFTFKCDIVNSIEDERFHSDVSEAPFFYPNPASATLFLNDSKGTVSLFNLGGEMILQQEGVSSMDISQLAPGIYLLRKSGNGSFKTGKLIVR